MARKPYRGQRTETLDYIQAMLGQLSIIARAERYDMLAYFIEMAYMEAGDIIRGQRPARLDQENGSSGGHEQRNGSP